MKLLPETWLSTRYRCRLVLAWVAVPFLLLSGCGPQGSPSKPGGTPTPPVPPLAAAGTLELTFTYGSEKEEWIKETTAAFNAESHRLAGGKAIHINALPMGSGDCLDEIIAGTRQTHLTSPASAAYIDLGNAQWRSRNGGRDLIAKTDSLLLSPVVIAMWRPMAEALGWPGKAVGWADILALARDERGWATLGHPEWGRFRFGHTHPEFSNSGLISLLAETYAGAGKKDALTLADVNAPQTAQTVAGIEAAVVHYGSSTGFFGKKMFANGPSYLNAAVLYENMVIESYSLPTPTAFPLVAIYPKEGTFWSDHPVGVVEREWVTPEHREAAKQYVDYLLNPAQQAKALPHGFRPASLDVPLGAPVDAAHGVDPKEPKTTLPVPPVEVTSAVLASFKEVKKTANLTLVLDVSGSMNEQGKIDAARAGSQQLIAGLGDRDLFSLLIFNQRANWIMQDAPLSRERARATSTLGGLIAEGGTALYDSVALAYKRAQEQQAADPSRITALVVLTDGQDTDSRLKLEFLLNAIRYDSEKRTIRVFTIAYGKDADVKILQRIAEATQARSYQGTTENIRGVFRDIATFF